MTSNESWKVVLIHMIEILMMPAKLATASHLKTKVFPNKVYDVIVLSMTSPTKLYHANQIVS